MPKILWIIAGLCESGIIGSLVYTLLVVLKNALVDILNKNKNAKTQAKDKNKDDGGSAVARRVASFIYGGGKINKLKKTRYLLIKYRMLHPRHALKFSHSRQQPSPTP